MPDYQTAIDQLLQEAVTEKTFTLDIVDKIKRLKDDFASATKTIEDLRKEKQEACTESLNLQSKVYQLTDQQDGYDKRLADLVEREAQQERLAYELDFQRQRSTEIKELFGIVFRNPVVTRSAIGSSSEPNASTPGYGYISKSTNTTETEETK